MTGHSLGGALALLAAYDIHQQLGLTSIQVWLAPCAEPQAIACTQSLTGSCRCAGCDFWVPLHGQPSLLQGVQCCHPRLLVRVLMWAALALPFHYLRKLTHSAARRHVICDGDAVTRTGKLVWYKRPGSR